MKVALVHDWLTGMRGGEKVLERIARRYPEAPIYTLVWKRGAVSAALEQHPIHVSFVQSLPDAVRRYRWYLPLFPAAIERFDLSEYDQVISTSHCVAKGVRTRPDAFHLSYIHTPMRYIWELEADYFPPGRFPWPIDSYVRGACARLRRWDVETSRRPTALVANSAHVAARIARHWGREATVVHPPVRIPAFTPAEGPRDYYTIAGAFAPYKRVDLAIEACRRLGRRLVVAGSGQEERALRARAGPEIRFEGWLDDDAILHLLRGSKAMLFPGEEDFGITPVEAMAVGCPVIAYGAGGVLETVGRGIGETGLETVRQGGVARAPGGMLFGTQSVEGMVEAIEAFERESFDPRALRARAESFSPERFDREFDEALDHARQAWAANPGRRVAT